MGASGITAAILLAFLFVGFALCVWSNSRSGD
jgi:hypothetical protein